MKTEKEFFDRARWIFKQLDWMSDKGYQDHPITGNEPTYEERMNEPNILANRIITPDGTVMQSFGVHDYKEYIDKNGLEYMVDGGLHYLRRNMHDDAPYIEASVYDTDPHNVIREAFHWGSYGKGGDQPLKRLSLSTMSDNHIEAILQTQHHIGPHIRKVFEDEQEFRLANNIKVEDTE